MSIIETEGGEHGRVFQIFIYQFESTLLLFFYAKTAISLYLQEIAT